jgi:antitoxin YefM
MLVANISQFRKNLKFYIDSVADNHDTLIVNGNGKTVVMVTLDKFNEMDETEYLLSTPANKTMMERALAQSKEGIFISKTMEELEAMVNVPSPKKGK